MGLIENLRFAELREFINIILLSELYFEICK